jgi:ADP-dependent NAD(P)H-hydrate dehydratase / NAD(P)H-hydrate epimerase
MKIVSVQQMRALEAAAFASGIDEPALQQRAGCAVAEEVFRLVQPEDRVVVLVGHGNNGRDGAVAADWLSRHQVPVDLVLLPRHALSVQELASLQAHGVSVTSSASGSAVEQVLSNATVAIDALVGIGARGALREPLAAMARRLNIARAARRASLHVVALDVPSGVDADTGAIEGDAVWADSTVTLGGVKQGLLRLPGAERVGRLIPRSIGIPESAEADLPYSVLDEPELARLVPARPLDSHKYRFGRVLVVGGTDHYPGAPVLCCGAAARIGAGLVTLASTREVRLNVSAHLAEVTYTAEDVSSTDGVPAARQLEAYVQSASTVLIGPGLGRGQATTDFVGELLRLRRTEQRLVIDADGLFALSEMEDWPRLLGATAVLTPHSGELERLVGHKLSDAEPNWERAGRLAAEWGCVLVAKGPFTAIASPDGRVDVWPRANPALATGGTGDVLAGITAGLLAQGLPVRDAARLAVGVHALAAERIVDTRGWRTLLASDLLTELPAVLERLARPTRPR